MKVIFSIYKYISLKLIEPTSLSTKFKLILLLFSLVGIALILMSTSLFGAGLSSDSVYYISTARNLGEGNGLISYTGAPFIDWPPLYAIILATPYFIFRIDPLISAPFINAVLFGLIVYFSGLLLSRHLVSSIAYSLLGAALLLFSNVLQDLYTMVWSETLFILLVILFLFYLEKYLEKKDRTSLIVLSLAVALAGLTRYIGVTLILTGTLALFFFLHDKLRTRLYSIAVFVLISILPTGIWLIRNFIISGTLLGHRGPSTYTLHQNLTATFETVHNWSFFPPKGVFGIILLIIFIILMAGFIGRLLTKGKILNLGTRMKLIGPVALYFVIYISFLIYSSTSYSFDPINWRLLTPIYIPATLLLLFLIDIFLEPFREKISPLIINGLLVITMIAWLVHYPVMGTLHYTYNRMVGGTGGFNSIEWRNNSIIKYLQLNPLESGHQIYSNETDVLYILLNIKCQIKFITITSGPPDTQLQQIKNLSEWNHDGYDYFIYFDNIDPRSYPYTKDQMQNSLDVFKIIQVSDGAIFAVKRIP